MGISDTGKRLWRKGREGRKERVERVVGKDYGRGGDEKKKEERGKEGKKEKMRGEICTSPWYKPLFNTDQLVLLRGDQSC